MNDQSQPGAEAMTERRWATEQEAADHARVSGNTLRRWRAQGLLGDYKVGRTVRYDLAEIDRMITAGGQASPDTTTPPEQEQRSAAHQDA